MVVRISAEVEQVQGHQVTLVTGDSQHLRCAFEDVPQIGDTYILTILPEAEAKLDQEELGRSLLNQLLVTE